MRGGWHAGYCVTSSEGHQLGTDYKDSPGRRKAVRVHGAPGKVFFLHLKEESSLKSHEGMWLSGSQT